MSTWRIRHEGSPTAVTLPSAARILEGLRDGDWEPTDEVRGPSDTRWSAIESHPAFEEIVADMVPPPPEPPDETKLDMNPLIDVALVLLIFFILTATYSTLRRSIELPPSPPDGATSETIKVENIKDDVFKVRMWMEDGQPKIKIEDKGVVLEELEREVAEIVKATGRKKMFMDVAGDVPWGIESKLYDAAKAAGIHEIYQPKGR